MPNNVRCRFPILKSIPGYLALVIILSQSVFSILIKISRITIVGKLFKLDQEKMNMTYFIKNTEPCIFLKTSKIISSISALQPVTSQNYMCIFCRTLNVTEHQAHVNAI